MVSNQQPLEKTALNIAGEKHNNQSYLGELNDNTMKKYTSTIAALLLVLCAVWNIRCESDKAERQAAFLQYIHENSKPYKQSLKQDTLFAQRLDSIKLLEQSNEAEVNKNTTHKPQNLYKKKY